MTVQKYDNSAKNAVNSEKNIPDAAAFAAEAAELKDTLQSGIVTGADLLTMQVKDEPGLIDPIFQRSGLAALTGSSDVGKSLILRQLAIAIAGKRSHFLGWRINARHHRVVFISTEDGQRDTARLFQKQAAGMRPADAGNIEFVFNYLEHEPASRLPYIDARLTEEPADLVIVDSFGDVHDGQLNDTHRIRQTLNGYGLLADKHDCLFLFLHHTGKRTEQFEPNKNNILGGQGFEAKMRGVVELRADQHDPTVRHFCITKGNYLSWEFKKESYVLAFDQEGLTFTHTGDRVPFHQLAQKQESAEDRESKDHERYEAILTRIKKGQSYSQIAPDFGYRDKTGIAQWIKRHRTRYGITAKDEPDTVDSLSTPTQPEKAPF